MTLISGTWITAADVLAVTGVNVGDSDVAQAQGVIDIISNVTTEDSATMSARDIRLISLALCYQTVWQYNQIDVLTRTDVASITQDGLQFTPANKDALMLAPLAKRCLDRLSWRKPRSIRVRPGRGTTYQTIEALQDAWLRDADGLNAGWQSGDAS